MTPLPMPHERCPAPTPHRDPHLAPVDRSRCEPQLSVGRFEHTVEPIPARLVLRDGNGVSVIKFGDCRHIVGIQQCIDRNITAGGKLFDALAGAALFNRSTLGSKRRGTGRPGLRRQPRR